MDADPSSQDLMRRELRTRLVLAIELLERAPDEASRTRAADACEQIRSAYEELGTA